MWESRIESFNEQRAQKLSIHVDGDPISYAETIELWQDDRAFRSFFTEQLCQAPFEAYRWETPPVTSSTVSRHFECVILRSDALDRTVDRKAFAEHFDENPVVTFANLSGDAILVVPCPIDAISIYGHLASFLRNAPGAQVDSLWQSVGNAIVRFRKRRVAEECHSMSCSS